MGVHMCYVSFVLTIIHFLLYSDDRLPLAQEYVYCAVYDTVFNYENQSHQYKYMKYGYLYTIY